MKKVILYGIQNKHLRAKVANYLSDEFKILGISDSYLNKDNLQAERFIKPDDISAHEYDYILILSERENVQEEIREKLTKLNVKKDKIIVPRLLLLKNADFIPDLKKEITDKVEQTDITYEAAMMGLSYSLRGIDFEKLCLKCIDFSWHGMDLYYNYKLLGLLLAENCNKLNIQTFIMMFPFYYLNYDMSKSLYQFLSGQIFACRGFGDWHNAGSAPNYSIREYLICEKLFGKKFWKYKNWKKVTGEYTNTLKMDKIELSEIWKKNYKETCKENKKLIKKILEMLKGRKIIFIIPPIFMELIKESDLDYFYSMKKYFLGFLKEQQLKYQFEIFDFSCRINDASCFSDYSHLNEKGRTEFTDLVNHYLSQSCI